MIKPIESSQVQILRLISSWKIPCELPLKRFNFIGLGLLDCPDSLLLVAHKCELFEHANLVKQVTTTHSTH